MIEQGGIELPWIELSLKYHVRQLIQKKALSR